jgi:hypothetical protein
MNRRIGLVLVVPLLLVLAACAPATHVALGSPPHPSRPGTAATTSASPTPSATPIVTKPIVPPTITPANYLVDGTPNVPDADGEWFGQWAFFTDATKSVWCQFIIFSGDNPGATCSIVPSARAQATYPKPSGISAGCATSNTDGYTLAMGGNADDLQPTADAGWDECIAGDPDIAALIAKTQVLPDGATLAVAPFSCTVKAGVGTCGETLPSEPTITISLGLHSASFHSTS